MILLLNVLDHFLYCVVFTQLKVVHALNFGKQPFHLFHLLLAHRLLLHLQDCLFGLQQLGILLLNTVSEADDLLRQFCVVDLLLCELLLQTRHLLLQIHESALIRDRLWLAARSAGLVRLVVVSL